MNSIFRLLSGGGGGGGGGGGSLHVFSLATKVSLLFFFLFIFFVNNSILVVLARPQDLFEMRLAEVPERSMKPVISQEEEIAKWKSQIGSACSWQNFDGGHWVAPNTCDAKAAKGECVCPLYFHEQREDAGFISTIIQCCVPASCADPNLPLGSSCMDSTKGDLCFEGSGRFVSNTNYGKACPNFPENIECCINSDDPPSSQFEQLIQQIDQSHDKKESQQQKQLNNHNSQNDANANLWPLSNDAISWLDTAPLDTWY